MAASTPPEPAAAATGVAMAASTPPEPKAAAASTPPEPAAAVSPLRRRLLLFGWGTRTSTKKNEEAPAEKHAAEKHAAEKHAAEKHAIAVQLGKVGPIDKATKAARRAAKLAAKGKVPLDPAAKAARRAAKLAKGGIGGRGGMGGRGGKGPRMGKGGKGGKGGRGGKGPRMGKGGKAKHGGPMTAKEARHAAKLAAPQLSAEAKKRMQDIEDKEAGEAADVAINTALPVIGELAKAPGITSPIGRRLLAADGPPATSAKAARRAAKLAAKRSSPEANLPAADPFSPKEARKAAKLAKAAAGGLAPDPFSPKGGPGRQQQGGKGLRGLRVGKGHKGAAMAKRAPMTAKEARHAAKREAALTNGKLSMAARERLKRAEDNEGAAAAEEAANTDLPEIGEPKLPKSPTRRRLLAAVAAEDAAADAAEAKAVAASAAAADRADKARARKPKGASGAVRIGAPRADMSGVGVTSQAYSPAQQWVVLRSLATNTFVSVEPPPHTEANVVHGRGESISLNNVFGFLRGGFVWAKSTGSLLNVCSTEDEICTGHLEKEGDLHFKRLQAPMESATFEFRTVSAAALGGK